MLLFNDVMQLDNVWYVGDGSVIGNLALLSLVVLGKLGVSEQNLDSVVLRVMFWSRKIMGSVDDSVGTAAEDVHQVEAMLPMTNHEACEIGEDGTEARHR